MGKNLGGGSSSKLIYLLIPLFGLIAFFYSLIGFGGGSSYLAVLSLPFFKIPYLYIPLISLFCNLIVSGKSMYSFLKIKYFKLSYFLYFIPSLLSAFLGALIPLPERNFLLLLGLLLIISGLLIFLDGTTQSNYLNFLKKNSLTLNQKNLFFLITFSWIGFLAGLTGIGGGIYLAPILYNFTRLKVLEITALTSGFIFCNSFFGLAGQVIKLTSINFFLNPQQKLIELLIALGLVVGVGGSLGNKVTLHYISTITIKKLTALFVLGIGLYLVISPLK